MKDHFFDHVRIFIIIVLLYTIIYKTILKDFIQTQTGYETFFAIVLTATIMTTFELLFVWANYYWGLNNAIGVTINQASDNQTTTVDPDKVSIVADILGIFGISNAEQTDQNNSLVNTLGLLLIFILMLILLAIYLSGCGKSIPGHVIWSSILTAICLSLFFGFFYVSVTQNYKMVPNEFDLIVKLRDLLNLPIDKQGTYPVSTFGNIVKPFISLYGFVIIIFIIALIFVNKRNKKSIKSGDYLDGTGSLFNDQL
jgi:hypothetical protein